MSHEHEWLTEGGFSVVALLTSSKGSIEACEAGSLFWGQGHMRDNLSARIL